MILRIIIIIGLMQFYVKLRQRQATARVADIIGNIPHAKLRSILFPSTL